MKPKLTHGTLRTEDESMSKPNHVRAARQIVNAIEQDGNSADYALRVIPAEFKGAIQVGDVLPVSKQWVNGDETKTNLEGTSAARILNADEKSVVDALRNLGANGKDGSNGYYFGSRVVLIKGDSMGSGEDVGEVLIKGAEVVGMWNKPTNGSSEVMPNTDAGDISQSTIGQKIDQNIKLSTSRDQTEMPAFRKWFGDSQVVNDDGTPMVVYHGTNADFSEFLIPNGDADLGAHFGTIEQATIRSSGGESINIMPVYLSIGNPLRLEDGGDFFPDEVYRQLDEIGITMGEGRGISVSRDAIIAAGYDGVVYLNRREIPDMNDPYGDATLGKLDDEVREAYPDAQDSYIAFRPEQIKSAIGNNGNFDAANPDIRFSMPDVNEVEDEAENDTNAPCP